MDDGRSASGSGVVPAARVRVSAEAVRVGPARPANVPEPQVQVIREGEAVRVIQVTCTCGEKICIRCEY